MNAVAVDPALLEQLKTILRRDLRLGADATIADDMPLVGGPTDLDSIDILLLVSSIEKQFHIKIPNEAVGRSAFATVGTLARYVQDNRETLRVAPATESPVAASAEDPVTRLPHGPEFRFVTSVRDLDPGRAASGTWAVRGDEFFLAGHFPGRPIVPGVLIGEAVAQIAGIAAADSTSRGGMLARIDLRFLAPVVPPASIELRAAVSRREGPIVECEVVASVSGRTVAQGSLTLRLEA